LSRLSNVKPRTPNLGKSDKKGNLFIKCKKCNKWISATTKGEHNYFADPRLICIHHCDTITLFPSRVIDKLIENPDKEFIE
jgi:hypothetical protein